MTASIRLEANQYIEPKHGSGGTVYVDPSLMKELLSFKGPEQDGFVVNSPLGWKATTYRRYRCEPHWRTLIGWLESNGINARRKFMNCGSSLVTLSSSDMESLPAAHNCDIRRSK